MNSKQRAADGLRPSIPQRFRSSVLADWKTDADTLEAWENTSAYLDDIETYRQDGVGITYSGYAGRGKTMLACIVANHAMAKGYTAHFLKLSAHHQMYLRMFDLKDAWAKMGDEGAYEEWRDIQRRLDTIRKKIDFLVIDDVGKEHRTSSGFAEDGFDFLLRDRYDRGLPTIMTTNLPVSDWGKQYSPSMESFIHEATMVLPVVSESDYRRR